MSFTITHIASQDMNNICAALQASKILKEEVLHASRQSQTEDQYLDAANKLNLLDLKQLEIECGRPGLKPNDNFFAWIYDQLDYTATKLDHPDAQYISQEEWYQSAIKTVKQLALNRYNKPSASNQFNNLFE